MKNQQRNSGKGIKLITVLINGKAIQVNPDSLVKENQRTVLHGEYKGIPVNSPAISILGDRPDDSVIFWPNADKSFAVAMSKSNLGMLSIGFLKTEGATVKFAA